MRNRQDLIIRPFFEDLLPAQFFRNNRLFKWENDVLKTDIKELDKDYVLSINMPGLKKEDVNLELKNGELTVKVERKEEKDEENDRYVLRERSYSSTYRSFSVGDHVKQSDIKAKMEDGVLTITIPKEVEKEEKIAQITIE